MSGEGVVQAALDLAMGVLLPELEMGDGEADLTIDDLAARSQVPSRTIRFYQSKGVLPKPEMKGRVAYYGQKHVERLELIASLQDRGLRIEAIRELVLRIDRGEVDIGEWLGLEAQLQQPWDDDQPRTVTEEELYELSGRKRVGLLNDLVRGKLVERRGNVLFVPSPALLAIATRLEGAGLDLDVVMKARTILEKHIGRAAKELTELAVDRAGAADELDPAKTVEHLRPLAMEGVRVLFAHAMQNELREIARSPKVAKVSARRARADRRS
ncbi:MAG: MerR family transcriptional regulator [Labilithrix sp.]|nr:MerR family transcriptional regulator [Labilithrix sp.]MCW5811136.1 MerR family transcriptional regulator [Labilithrix sp.]